MLADAGTAVDWIKRAGVFCHPYSQCDAGYPAVAADGRVGRPSGSVSRPPLNGSIVRRSHVLAFCKPRFYELDQAISVGDADKFDFFMDPHFSGSPTSPPCRDRVLVFANTLQGVGPTVAIRCTILSIVHPQLGSILSIDTKGLDYRITLLTGEVVEVNAEEQPGTIHEAPSRVTDWSFLVDVQPEAPNKT